jgi:hypothetical protein
MIKLPIEVGDTILTGKFRNHRTVVETIETDEWGHPTVNGKPILKVRIEKLMQDKKESNMNRLEKVLGEAGEKKFKVAVEIVFPDSAFGSDISAADMRAAVEKTLLEYLKEYFDEIVKVKVT